MPKRLGCSIASLLSWCFQVWVLPSPIFHFLRPFLPWLHLHFAICYWTIHWIRSEWPSHGAHIIFPPSGNFSTLLVDKRIWACVIFTRVSLFIWLSQSSITRTFPFHIKNSTTPTILLSLNHLFAFGPFRSLIHKVVPFTWTIGTPRLLYKVFLHLPLFLH